MKYDSLKRTLLATALLSLAAVPLAGFAAGDPNETVSHSDKSFVEKASQGGVAEVQLGKLAAQKAQSPEVKKFGDRMAKDHAAANEKLTALASKKGLAAASDMDSSSKREYDKLSKLSGADFDKEYMKQMVSDHKKDIKEFQSQAKSGKDADIKNFAQSTLPTLEDHLKQAEAAEANAKNEKTASK
jgi:putative membrane protein